VLAFVDKNPMNKTIRRPKASPVVVNNDRKFWGKFSTYARLFWCGLWLAVANYAAAVARRFPRERLAYLGGFLNEPIRKKLARDRERHCEAMWFLESSTVHQRRRI